MKTRIISGAVGIVLFVAAVFASVKFSSLILLGLLVIIGCIAVYEALVTTGYAKSKFIAALSIGYAVVAPVVYSLESGMLTFFKFMLSHETVIVLYGLTVFVAAMFMHEKVTPTNAAFSFAATVGITFCFWSLAAVFCSKDGHGLFYLIIVVIAAWACDTGAYFSGYFFGRHKMAPVISPKKTVEGAIGGVIFDMLAVLAACIIFNHFSNATANIWLLVGLTPVLAVAGMFGDLVFSYIKRACGIKDYGKIMPGHGGVLDRFDSVVAVAPLVYLIVAHFPIVA
ncbi:MAG: hypothetical protein E7525_04140 [Ruminococcaceae bacterium]|nr:hypothetical protein [Oscillospiraceae bacterium]